MTSRRCYIHVGLPKTGTSYLQSIVWRSRAALADQGLKLLPSSMAATFNVMLAVRGQLRAELDRPRAFAAFERFREQAAGASGTRALISQELLGAAEPDQIATLLGALPAYEAHVIVTVRDLASFVPSAWQQHVQARGEKSFQAYLDDFAGSGSSEPHPAYDVHGVLDRWGTHVPPDRVHIVTVTKRGTSERVLLERYCRVLAVDPDGLDTQAPAANTSLGLVQAELLRRVNVALGGRLPHPRAGYRQQGKVFLAGAILRPQQGEAARLPHRLAGWCAEASEAIVARLAGSGYDIVGDLADLVPDPSAFTDDDQDVSDNDIADAATLALASVLEQRAAESEQPVRPRARPRGQRRAGSPQRRSPDEADGL